MSTALTIPTHSAVAAPVEDVWRMAQAIAKSGLFGMKSPEQAMALMLVAQAEGMHPATAARDYHIVNGRPALKADAMLARFHAAGGKVEWKTYTPEKVSAVFSHAAGGTVEIEWTFAQAKAANLTNKDTWKQYPRQMLRARVISEGIRTVFPGVAVGVYTPEEVQDFAPPATLTVVESEVAPAEKPISVHRARKEGGDEKWKAVEAAFNSAETVEELDAAGKEHGETIRAFPAGWQGQARELYRNRKAELEEAEAALDSAAGVGGERSLTDALAEAEA